VAIVYAAGVFFAVSAALMFALDLWLLLTGRVSDDQLVMIKESEDVAALEQHSTGGNAAR
jgi:TRAP-type C4-dicarboxylate transport system permease small subunit